MSASSRFFKQQSTGGSSSFSSGGFLKKIKYWMEHHPIASNSFLCLNLWVVGDMLAQYSEHKLLKEKNLAIDEEEKKKSPLRKFSTKLSHRLTETDSGLRTSTATTTSSSSDSLVVEEMEKGNEDLILDFERTIKCASYGALISGPLLAKWYPFLDKACIQYNITSRYGIWGAPVAKVLADEFVMDPPCLVLFYGYMNAFEGGDMQSLQQKLNSEFLRSWLTSLAVWPIVLLGTFRFLPVYAHAPLINTCCIVWDGFLSHRNAVARAEKIQQQQQQQQLEAETNADEKEAKK